MMVEESTMSLACFVFGGVLPFGVEGWGGPAANGSVFK